MKSPEDPIVFYKSDLLIPDHLKFDPQVHDLSIDLAYKIFLFVFYRCSEFFELKANDHSEMAEKVQSLFNYPIVKRWLAPQLNILLRVLVCGDEIVTHLFL